MKTSTLKPSGIDWLGEIPVHWNYSKIVYYAKLKTGGTPDRNKPEYWDSGNINWMSSGEVNKKIIYEIDTKITQLGYENSNATLLAVNSVMIALNGQGKTKGKVAVLKVTTSCNQSLASFICDEKNLHYKYLYYFLESKYKELRGLVGDELREGLTLGLLKTLFIPLPSFAEQCNIAGFLDWETEKIEDLISKKGILIDLLKEERVAIVNQVVTKGIDPIVPMKNSGVEWIGKMPAHWEVSLVKRIARIRYGLGQPPAKSDDGKPLIRATNIKSGRIVSEGMLYVDPHDVPIGRNAELSEGEIIVVRSGAYTGDSAIITKLFEGAIAGYDMVVTVIKGYSPFIAWQLLSKDVRELQFGFYNVRAAQPHLNAEELGGTIITIPPLPEQDSIASYLDHETNRIDLSISKIQREIGLLHEYRAALISEVVTGKIDVRDEVNAWT